jgi:hypothetical protein
LLIVSALAQPARGWNEFGHLAVARLAWHKLNAHQRQAASEILKAHPHYQEYLTAECPAEISPDEWAFMRGAYWPDWVRSNHSDDYNHPTWHYISVAYVPPYSRASVNDIPFESPNVVTQIPAAIDKIRTGDAAEKAISLCWLMHLVGDIHQPLHCASLLNETFPRGDQGGNLALIRIEGGAPMRLHVTWDWILGDLMAVESLESTVAQLQQFEASHGDELDRELTEHLTSADWAREGFEWATAFAYLHGDLRPANAELHPADDSVPSISQVYLQDAEGVARRRATQAGRRLAASIAQSLQ